MSPVAPSQARAWMAIAAVLLFLTPLFPPSAAMRMVAPDTTILAAGLTMPAASLTAGAPASFSLYCTGVCGGTTGPKLEFRFNGGDHAESAPALSFTYSQKTTLTNGTLLFSYAPKLPRALKADFRVTFDDGSGPVSTDWERLGVVKNSQAKFVPAYTRNFLRGATPVPITAQSWYSGYSSGVAFDKDAWDVKRPASGAAPPQWTLWDLGPYGAYNRTIYSPSDVPSLNIAPRVTHITRDGCIPYNVTVDDTVGLLREGEAYRAGDPSAYYDPTSPLVNGAGFAQSRKTYAGVEHLCVVNFVPQIDAKVFADPADDGSVIFYTRHLRDDDNASGYDKLVFEVWDRDLHTVTNWSSKQASLVGTWDWNGSRFARFPLSSFVDGASLCVMDREKDAIVNRLHVADVANLARPVCKYFPAPLGAPPAPNAVSRLVIETGPANASWVVESGSLVETHRVLAYDPQRPLDTADALAGVLADVLADAIGPDRYQQVVLQSLQVAQDEAASRLAPELAAAGVLLVVPAGVPSPVSAGLTPHWEIRGLAASPDVLTVGAAKADGTAARAGSAFGPSPVVRPKPDVTVRVPDALDDATAQLQATLYAANLALWYELRGIQDPALVKALVMRQALPAHDAQSLGIPSTTGAGVLDPARFSSNLSILDAATLPLADLNATMNITGAAEISPLPVVSPNALLDVGVVNRDIAKSGQIALVNPNTLLRNLSETPRANLSRYLPVGADPYSDPSLSVTVNVTFYALLDVLNHNLTDELVQRETIDRLADLASSQQLDGSPSPFEIPQAQQDAILAAVSGGDLLHKHYFVPEVTQDVPGSKYKTSCAAPSLQPIAYHVSSVLAYMQAVGLNSNGIQPALDAIQAVSWNDCSAAVAAIAAQVAIIQGKLAAYPLDGYVAPMRATIGADFDRLKSLALRSTNRAQVVDAFEMGLSTDPGTMQDAQDAPPGPYIGVVRITTHGLCKTDIGTGQQTSCADSSDYVLASLWLDDTTNFVLRDRAGRPMPGRPVTLDWMAPGQPNCASTAGGLPANDAGQLLSTLFPPILNHVATTDSDGVARFPFVLPGYYDLHDGYVGFPLRTTFTPQGATKEDFGFREKDCHNPVPIHLSPHVDLALALTAAQTADCLVKTALGGLPVVNVRAALELRAANLSGPVGCTDALTQDGASQALDALDVAGTLFGEESWEIIFPQVQQGRLADKVQGFHMMPAQIGEGILGGWEFQRNATSAKAVPAPNDALPTLPLNLTLPIRSFGVLQYDYKLPPNEELAHFWRFRANMANTQGLAVFTLREDVTGIVQALATEQPTSAVQAAALLAGFAADSAVGGTGECAPLAHYRIVPLSVSPNLVDATSPGVPDEPEDFAHLDVGVHGFEKSENVSRFFRFHTRECPRAVAHVLFVFWQLPIPGLNAADVRFEIEDQRIWTWGGVGNPAPDAGGDWSLVKLPDGWDLHEPFQVGTEVSHVVLEVGTYEPKAESWDLFVDGIDETSRLEIWGIPPQNESRLVVHPIDDPRTASWPNAPDVIGTLEEWVREFDTLSYDPFGGAMASESDGSTYQTQAGMYTPGRTGPASDDGVLVKWSDDPGCDFHEFGRRDGVRVFGEEHDVARVLDVFELLGLPGLSSNAHVLSTLSWLVNADCGLGALPETYFHMFHATRDMAEQYPFDWGITEYHPHGTEPDGYANATPTPPLVPYPILVGPWEHGKNDGHRFLDVGVDACETLPCGTIVEALLNVKTPPEARWVTLGGDRTEWVTCEGIANHPSGVGVWKAYGGGYDTIDLGPPAPGKCVPLTPATNPVNCVLYEYWRPVEDCLPSPVWGAVSLLVSLASEARKLVRTEVMLHLGLT